MIEGIAFDLEGTGINVEEIHFNGFALAARESGFEIDFRTIVEKIPNAIGGGDKLISEGISRLMNGKISPEELLERKRWHYNDQIEKLERIKPRPGFLEALFRIIRDLKLPVAIASLTPRNQAVVLLKRSDLVLWFPEKNIVLAEDVENLKPHPDVYLETARRIGIDPTHQLAFEDSATGVEAATAAGSIVIAVPVFNIEKTMIQLVQKGAKRIFMDWREMNIKMLIRNLNKESFRA